MKKVLIVLCLFNILICFSQSNTNEKIYVSNSQNFKLSPFFNIALKKKVTKFSFTMKISEINWSKYYNKIDSKVLKIDEYKLNTALSFKEKESNLIYYYPISDSFNDNYFEKKINFNSKEELTLKFFTAIYKTKNNPVVIINCIKVLKD